MVRILIANDSPPVRRGLRTLLEFNSDWQVCGEAVDGADAVEKAQQLAPDLIFMDFSMPQMDGVQAAQEIAESGAEIPILLFTLNLSPQIAELARNAGGKDFCRLDCVDDHRRSVGGLNAAFSRACAGSKL